MSVLFPSSAWNFSLIGSTTSAMNFLTWFSSGNAFSLMRRSLSSSCGFSAKLDCGRSAVMVIGGLPGLYSSRDH